MKKKVLALSIAAMIGGVAHAGVSFPGVATATTATTLSVSPDGVGHILLVPYFSTNNGNATLLSLVNTDLTNGKAVKVRFRSAANSDDIFDFQVYMSPGDVWTANVSQGADGKSKLETSDKSCTLPFSVNQSFITDRLPAAATAEAKAAWTREGYVEIFNMADIVDTAAVNDLYTAIKHANGVAPCSTSTFDWSQLQVDPVDVAAAEGGTLNFRAPSTGLMGSWTVINVAGASVAWSGNATAIAADGTGRIVFSPQMATPAATPNLFTSDPLFRTFDAAGAVTGATAAAGVAVLTAANFDLPDLSTPYTGVAANADTLPLDQANLVSASIAVQSVLNEYLTDTAITAATDWTFSMPTRRYSVAVNYASASADKRIYKTGSNYFTSANTSFANNLVCTAAGDLASRDREERFPAAGFVISPGTPTALEFCGEVSVLSFNSTNVLGATVASKNIDATYRDGWLTVSTPGIGGAGLPILGAAFTKATGPVVEGKSTNFGLTNGHRFTR